MPKKLVPNPAYRDAPYQLMYCDKNGVRVVNDPLPPRSLIPYPETITNFTELALWFREHGVPSHILVEDSDPAPTTMAPTTCIGTGRSR